MICLLVLVSYLPAIRGGFIWDDDAYVTENSMLVSADGLKQIWFSAHSQSQYFPLVYTVLRVEHVLWGEHAIGYHLVNVLFHCVNALLLLRLLTLLGVPGAWLASAVFAVHPVQVETVAWITELKNTQSTLFYLLAASAWWRFISPRGPRSWFDYGVALVCYCLALFSKTTACTLPAALILILWMEKVKFSLRRAVEITPFVIFGVVMGLVSVWWEGHLGAYAKEYALDFSLLKRFLIATRALWFYAGKLVCPLNLMFSYPKWDIDAADPIAYVWAGACLVLCAWLYRRFRQGDRAQAASVLFFVAALCPMLGFFSLYTFRYSFVADHYQYLASAGLIALFGASMSRLASAWPIPPLARSGAKCALLVTLCVLTWRQSGAYSDVESLWRDTVQKNPKSWIGHNNLGAVLIQQGRTEEALDCFRTAIEVGPNYFESRYNVGTLLAQRGRSMEAIDSFKRSLELNPNCVDAHYNLGLALEQSGKPREAISEYRKALDLNPSMVSALNNMAWILASQPDRNIRDGPEAVRLAEQASRLTEFREPIIVGTLAAALAEAGRFDEAAATAERAAIIALSSGKSDLAEKNRRLAELYRSGRAYHEDPEPATMPQKAASVRKITGLRKGLPQ